MISVILIITVLLTMAAAGISPVLAKQAPIVVSMGDSYASGEGTDVFYGSPTAAMGSKDFCDWLAHRSPKVWSGQLVFSSLTGSLADHKDKNWFLIASSGAVTDDIVGVEEKAGKLVGQNKPYKRKDIGNNNNFYLDPQINIFDNMGGKRADYITLSIGGNDVGFSNVLLSAAISGPSYQHVNLFHGQIGLSLSRIPETKKKLKNVYKTISEKAGPQAKIIVTGYPQLIDTEKCIGSLINPNEALIMNSATTLFNNAIESTVNECNELNIEFVDIEREFKGHGAYAGDKDGAAWINGFVFNETNDNNLDQKTIIRKQISDASFHPNLNGQAAYARCVQAKINELEGGTQTPKPTESNNETQPHTTFDDSNPIAMLGLPLESILEKYGSNYTTVDEPGSGTKMNICYPNTGNPYEFGIDEQTNLVKVVYVYDINDKAISLFDDVTNRTTLSEMTATRNKYTCEVNNNIQLDNTKQIVNFAYDKRIMVSFEWINNDTSDKADRVLIIKTNEDIQFREKSQSQDNDSQNSLPKGNLEEWKQLYLDFLRSDEAKYFTSACLVYLNDDDIPELALHTDFMLNGTQLCWITNGKTEYQAIGALGTFRERPKQGIMALYSLNHGIQGISIDQFDGQTINRIHFGEITDTGVYRWDNVEITESEYKSNIAEYADLTEPSFITKENMISALQN